MSMAVFQQKPSAESMPASQRKDHPTIWKILNSTNGTWADRIQLDPYELFPLENGMRVTFASVEYEVEV